MRESGADAYLLVWMYERSRQGQGDPVSPDDFPEEWRRSARFKLRTDLHELVRRDQLKRVFAFGKGHLYRLTYAGELEAQRLLHLRRDTDGRQQHARDGLVSTAFRASYSPTVVLEAFLTMPQSFMYGSPLTLAEVRTAAAYLAEQGLATLHEGDAQHPLQALLTLTQVGIQCAGSSLSVKDYLMQNGHHPTYTTNMHGGTAQVGSGNTQNNTFGFDPSQFADFARQVLAAAPRVGTTDELRDQIALDASSLEAESTSQAPEPGGVRRALERLVGTLERHATDSLAQYLYDAGRNLLP
ncbi:hypothetical protein ACIOKD_09010 [Streptomyces sp. NPDC087844]|uniref:hypothetical protein n=1 Tax=Streptomyces sp. NPDC087844 TaxID=3365805 RepID=UPI003803210B